MRKVLVALALALVACSSDGGDGDGAPEGYVRYRTPPVELQPGESGFWATWVANPADHDLDILDVQGWQSIGGHHAVMYSTTNNKPLGTTRAWQDVDQLTSRFLGGVGGEGAN